LGPKKKKPKRERRTHRYDCSNCSVENIGRRGTKVGETGPREVLGKIAHLIRTRKSVQHVVNKGMKHNKE